MRIATASPGKDAACILLTGVTGFVGKVVLYQLMQRRAELRVDRVYVVIRPKRGRLAAQRLQEVVASPCFADLPAGWSAEVHPVGGNLSRHHCGIAAADRALLATQVTHVIHCAASVDFDLPVAQACDANITASLNMLALAQTCGALRRMVSVSTAYVTPHRPGPIFEELAPLPRAAQELYDEARQKKASKRQLLDETGHPNTYTLTKCIAEHLLLQRRGTVPLSIVRPSIISAAVQQPFSGWIDSDAALAGFVSAIGGGLMHVVNADYTTHLDVVPVDEVASRVIGAAFLPGDHCRILHAVAGIEHGCDVRTWIGNIVAFFARYPGPRRARVAYLGPPGRNFALRRMVHQVAPARVAEALCRLRGNRAGVKQARRLVQRLDLINQVFPYFTHKTFDFRASEPLEKTFDIDGYVSTCVEGVATHLMRRRPREVLLAGRRHRAPRSDLLWAASRPAGNLTIRLCAVTLAKVLRRTFDQVTFDQRSFERASERAAAMVGGDGGVVLVPTHRSYMDFLVCSYLLFARPELRLRIPHIAAAREFADIKVVGRLFRRMQAFYLSRGLGAPDPQLTAQVSALVRAGATLQFFIEGERSRARLWLAPRRGLLRCLQSTGQHFALLPVSMSYERVPEEGAFVHELRGHPKAPMRLRGLLGWTRRMWRGEVRLGRLHIACGEPVALTPQADVHACARQVMAELQRVSVVTDYHLAAFLRAHPRLPLSHAELRQAVERRGGRVLGAGTPVAPETLLDQTLGRTLRNQWAHLFVAEAARLQPENVALAHQVRHTLFAPPPPLPGDDAEALQPLLEALFADVCADYQAVARATLRGSPACRADAWLRHAAYRDYATARAALQGLEEAGLLRRVDGQRLERRGTAAQLEQFAARCAWQVAPPAKRRSGRAWVRMVTASG